MQNQLRITLHQINEHISEETVGPRKPRTRVRIHIIQVEALMHVSVRRALLQYLQALLNLLLVLRIITSLYSHIGGVRSHDDGHRPNVAGTYVRSADAFSGSSLEEVGVAVAEKELARVHIKWVVFAHIAQIG